MRFRLMLACVVAALAAPAAQASPPLPSVEDVLRLLDVGTVVQDYCVYEVQPDGTRRAVACVPGGAFPRIDIVQPVLS